MTIQEKSTAIGGGADLAQDIVENCIIEKVENVNNNFLCFQANRGGNLRAKKDDNQNGMKNFIRFDTAQISNGSTHASQTIIDSCTSLNGTESLAMIKNILKDFLNEAEYIENPSENIYKNIT